VTDTTLAEAITEVQRLTNAWGDWHTSHFPAAQSSFPTILNAVASGELLPKADAEMAVALAYQRASDRFPDGKTPWPPHAIRAAILALAPAEPLAEVQALKAELREARMQSLSDLGQAQDAWEAQKAAEAEVARLTSFLDDIQCGRGMFGLDAAVDLDWAVNHARAAITTKDTP
jgi:hypothetical protein